MYNAYTYIIYEYVYIIYNFPETRNKSEHLTIFQYLSDSVELITAHTYIHILDMLKNQNHYYFVIFWRTIKF